MRFVIFTHSLVSDWNHGNAHFLRGIASELVQRHHGVQIYEPADGWSRRNLIEEHGLRPITDFENAYPLLRSTIYDEASLDLDSVLRDADVVMVQEWNSHELVRRIGEHHREHPGYRLYFHDTHHRSATDQPSMSAYDLREYDCVLAYGNVIRNLYLKNGWAAQALTWHEAADTQIFRPADQKTDKEGELVWIGNWGDGERTEELRKFLIAPVKALGIKARVYGVRYPENALEELAAAGIEYGGWLPNYQVPEVFARFRVTIHIPRRPYALTLFGIPTIRPFEALACGIPLVSAPWPDSERLFRPGKDFVYASSTKDMTRRLRAILNDENLAKSLAESGLETIRSRHTCAHRVDELLAIAGNRRQLAVGGTRR